MKIQVLSASEARLQKFTALEFADGRAVVIGRGAECDLRIDDSLSSRRHARIDWVGGSAFVEDLESKNGTRLNGQGIRRAALSSNDQIQIGETLLTVTGVPDHERDTASVHFHDSPSPVLMTMNQNDADLLSRKTGAQQQPSTERQAAALQKLCRISQLVASSQDVDKTIGEVLDDLQGLLPADTASLLMLDAATADWRVVLSSQATAGSSALVVSRTIISQAISEGQAILSAHPLSDGRFDPSQSIVSQGISSAVCAPIRIENKFGGVLFLDRRKRAHAFDETDLRIVATVAGMLNILLERERLAMEAQRGRAAGA